jgi:DNA-binding Lrp family transcriptional regulator
LRKIESNNDSIEDILELKKQEFSNVEIGKRLGISESAVRRRLKKYQNTDEK